MAVDTTPKNIKGYYNVEGVGQVVLEAASEHELAQKVDALNRVYEGRNIVFVKKEATI